MTLTENTQLKRIVQDLEIFFFRFFFMVALLLPTFRQSISIAVLGTKT